MLCYKLQRDRKRRMSSYHFQDLFVTQNWKTGVFFVVDVKTLKRYRCKNREIVIRRADGEVQDVRVFLSFNFPDQRGFSYTIYTNEKTTTSTDRI